MKKTVFEKVSVANPLKISLSQQDKKVTLFENLLCFSHLRWDFVYQRPQHLLSRFADNTNVYFLEEPVFTNTKEAFIVISQKKERVWVCVPHLPENLNENQKNESLEKLIQLFFAGKDASEFIFWYYTPMALEFSSHIKAGMTVYDCMDELAAFKFAPQNIKHLENQLLERADIVFTGGNTLFQSKKNSHKNIHPFPSSIDKKHFLKARQKGIEPQDQVHISGPKIGFYGVIDERFDIGLIEEIANTRPDWNIILIGPVVKIDPQTLPQNKNIHFLGPKNYDQLPLYLSGWDVAMIPFLINESTRFISPTKTPEYLCGGKPVVSTPITDVINPYGADRLVSIANNAPDFIAEIAYWLESENKGKWLSKVDRFLLTVSWDFTCSNMWDLMLNTLASKETAKNGSAKMPQKVFKTEKQYPDLINQQARPA